VSLILTFDLGTTYFKVCLFDEAGHMVAAHRVAPPTQTKGPRCELPADVFRSTLVNAVQEIGKGRDIDMSRVAAICFATQANSFLLLDEQDRPLTPIILWTDERACPAEPVIGTLSEIDSYYRTTGVPAINGQFMAAKLLWIRQHQPDIWRRAARVCLISDYLTLWLTGRHVTEAGTAALTGLVDVHQLTWWPRALEHLSLCNLGLPRIARAGTDLGAIRSEAATALGLPDNCTFIVGCLDQYAGAIGAGNVTPGGVSETTGTVLATVRCGGRFEADAAAGVFQGPGFDDRMWFQMVFASTSANLLEAYRNDLADRPDYGVLCALAAEIPAGAEGLRVDTQDLSGTDRMFLGLNEAHGRGHRVRAILETVAHALNDQLRTLCSSSKPAFIRSVGGAARSDLWLQIKADALGLPVHAIACAEPTSLGAAILAAGAMRHVSPVTVAKEWVRIRTTCSPAAGAS
jgi:xylulokinase